MAAGLNGQPLALVVICMDSRFSLSRLLADARSYLWFKVRNAGSILSEAILDTMELAVVEKGVRLIVYTFHTGCAAEKGCSAKPGRYQHLEEALGQRADMLEAFMQRPAVAALIEAGHLHVEISLIDTATGRLRPATLE